MKYSSYYLALASVIALGIYSLAAQAQETAKPTIELNLDVLDALKNPKAVPAPTPYEEQEAPAPDAAPTPEGVMVAPGSPRLVWQKGPDGIILDKHAKTPAPNKTAQKSKADKKADAEHKKAEEEKQRAAAEAKAEKKRRRKEEKEAADKAAAEAAAVKETPAAPAPVEEPAPAVAPEAPQAAAPVPPAPPAKPENAAPAKEAPAMIPPPPAPEAPKAEAPIPPAAPAPVEPPKEVPVAPELTPAPVIPAIVPPPVPPLPEKPGKAEPVKPVTLTPPEPAAAPAEKPADAKPASGSANLTIAFKATETSLPLSVKPELDALAKKAKAESGLRLSLLAYASAGADQSSTARRVSLSRALAVRAYLIEQGVDKLAINVQAEGDKNPGGDPDRVDVVVEKGEKK